MIITTRLDYIANRTIFLLTNCSSPAHIHQIQAQLILHNIQSHTTIAAHFITVCQSHGLLTTACDLLFDKIHNPHVFVCNSLIRAFSHSQTPHFPYTIYSQMLKNSISPNNYTFTFLLKSLADFGELRKGQCVHTHVVKLGHLHDIYVTNSLLSVYAMRSGNMLLCRKLFDEMPERDVVSWTVLITGYRNARNYDEALIAFERMQYAGVVPNRVTMVNALSACAHFGATEMGVWIHDLITRNGWEMDVILGTALVDMYGKCGNIKEGLNVFENMKHKNVFTWNAAFKGLVRAGNSQEVISLFARMEQEGIMANAVTLGEVLSACSRLGSVEVGQSIFTSLINGKYGFSPNMKHYVSMIDLLTLTGRFEDALRIIREMPFRPTKSIWESFLGRCRAYGNLELSELAANKVLELEETDQREKNPRV